MVTEEDYYKLSEIIIAYAGTNFSDHEDRMTDVVTVVGGWSD